MKLLVPQMVSIFCVVSALALELWPDEPLTPLPKSDDIAAFANWPYREPPWMMPREFLLSKIGSNQLESIEVKVRAERRQLSRDDFLRFLEKGKQFTIADTIPERVAEPDWVCLEGVAFTKGGSALFWQMLNAKALVLWDTKKRQLFLVVDSDCIPQLGKQTRSLLQPPGADEIRGFCNAAPICYLGRADRDLVARESFVDFLSRGKAFATEASQRRPTEFWRAGGACLVVDTIYFFDRWNELTMFLEREDGASCVLVKAKADQTQKGVEKGILKH